MARLPGKKIDDFSYMNRTVDLRISTYMGKTTLYAYLDGEELATGTDVNAVKTSARRIIELRARERKWIKVVILKTNRVFGGRNIGDIDWEVIELALPTAEDSVTYYKRGNTVLPYSHQLPTIFPCHFRESLYLLYDEATIVYLEDLKSRFAELSRRVKDLIGSPDNFLEASAQHALTMDDKED